MGFIFYFLGKFRFFSFLGDLKRFEERFDLIR